MWMTLAGLPLILGTAAKTPWPVVPNSYRLVTVSLRKCRSLPMVAFKLPSSKFHSPLTGFGVGMPSGEGPPSAAMSSSDIRPWRICRLLIQHSVRSLSSSLNSSISGGSEKRESKASPSPVTVVVCLKPLIYFPTTRGEGHVQRPDGGAVDSRNVGEITLPSGAQLIQVAHGITDIMKVVPHFRHERRRRIIKFPLGIRQRDAIRIGAAERQNFLVAHS